MDNIVKTVYIIHLDGIPLLSMNLEGGSQSQTESIEGLFGGFSSAINTLIKELGHKELESIRVGDGLLVYSSKNPILFVVHANDPKHEQFARTFVKQVEYQFNMEFEAYLQIENAYLRGDRFSRFRSNILEINNHLMKIYQDHPEILEFLPGFIPLYQLYMVLNLGLDIIKGFPDDTIKLVRQLGNYFGGDTEMEVLVAQTIGRYSGHQIAQERFDDDFVIDQTNVLKMLNEISVTKYDKKNDVFDIVLCPVCRGKESTEPICQFFSGFIEGAIDNPNISVEQISCKAMGHESCKFQLHR